MIAIDVARGRAQGHRRQVPEGASTRTSSATRPTTTSWRRPTSTRARGLVAALSSRQGQPLPHRVARQTNPSVADRRALRRALARREDPPVRRRRGRVAELHRRSCAWSPSCCGRRSCGSSTTCCAIAAPRTGSRRSRSATAPATSATTLRDARMRERFGMTVLAMRASDDGRVDLQPRREREARTRNDAGRARDRRAGQRTCAARQRRCQEPDTAWRSQQMRSVGRPW